MPALHLHALLNNEEATEMELHISLRERLSSRKLRGIKKGLVLRYVQPLVRERAYGGY
jgi:hypothetical protein